MTADRPYRRARPHHAACTELQACAGTQFDPAVVDAFFAAHRLGATPPVAGAHATQAAADHIRAVLAQPVAG
jgi:HD-GYP domain-containing protein (c-di-GMP phosphodiesterase class II)